MEDREKLLMEIKGLISDSQKENVRKEDLEKTIKELNEKIAKLDNADIKALKESVEELVKATSENAAAIKAMNEAPKTEKNEKPRNLKEAFKQALIDAVMEKTKEVPGLITDKNDQDGQRKSLKDYFVEKGNRVTPSFTVKTLVDMLESNIVGANVSTVRLAELDPQRVGIPLTIYPHVLDWVPSKAIKRPNMSLLVVYEYEDGAGTKTEGSAPTKSSFKFKTVEFKSFFISTYFTLSDETLDDLEEAMEEIAATAPSKLLDSIDGKVLSAAGDDSSDIAGLYTSNKMTAFASATTYAAKVPNANKVDVIAMMKHQGEANKYQMDTVSLNPLDIALIAAEKDQLDNSKIDRRVVFNNIGDPVAVCGLMIKKSTSQTADTVGVLDSKQLMIGKRRDITMEIGYNGTDFTEGQKTVILKVRLAFGVRDKAAVIYCSGLDAAVTAISVV